MSARLTEHGRTQPGAGEILFVEASNGYWGTGPHERVWHITKAVTGWRLEFRDPEDERPTFAGVHGTFDRAKREAEAVTGAGRRAARAGR